MQDQEDENIVNEPAAAYGIPRKSIRVFSSFKEQEDEMITYWASITPLERLRNLHELIIHSFGLTDGKLKKTSGNTKIEVTRYES